MAARKSMPLSPREQQIARLIARGTKTGTIANILNRSIKTIETHRESIKKKLGVKSAPALVIACLTLLGKTTDTDPAAAAQRRIRMALNNPKVIDMIAAVLSGQQT